MRLRTANLLVAALGLLASGCAGGSDAKPTTLPSLTATPSSSSVAPSIPPQATANTSQALDAFVRFYFQQLNIAFSTSDASIVRAFSDPACGTCNNYIRAFSTTAGHVIHGESFAIVDVAAPPISPNGTLVEVFFTVPARDLVDQAGKVLERLPAKGMSHLTVNVVRGASGWSIRGIKKGDA